MSVDQIHTTGMSLAETRALLAHLEAEAANVGREIARPYFEHLLASNTCKPAQSPTSTWVGFNTDALTFTGPDGKTYKMTVSVTDVAAQEVRKLQKKAADLKTKEATEAADLLARLEVLTAAAQG